jgi:hypothetical protein
MGILANLAARSEMKSRTLILDFMRQVRDDWEVGPVLMPCHIINEVHNGIYMTTARNQVGMYRCQGYWWGYEVESEMLNGLRGPNALAWLRELQAAPPTNFGRIAPPQMTAGSFAAAIE